MFVILLVIKNTFFASRIKNCKKDNSMQLQQFLPKELRYAQYLVCAYVIITFIQAGVYLSIRLDHLNVIVGMTTIIDLIYGLWWLFLGWQLGRLRSWVRMTLLIFIALGIFISASQLVLGHFLAGISVFYEVYYYGTISLALVI